MAPPETKSPVGHETRDTNVRLVVLFGLGTAIVTVLVLLTMWVFYGYTMRREASRDRPAPPLAGEREPLMGPRLQVSPAQDLREMRESEDEYLNTYGWMDPERGIVRVPIDRAMDLLLEKGLPAREGGEASPTEEVIP